MNKLTKEQTSPSGNPTPNLTEIGRLAVQEYLADRAFADYDAKRYFYANASASGFTVRGARDLHAAKLRTELEREDAIFDYLATLP